MGQNPFSDYFVPIRLSRARRITTIEFICGEKEQLLQLQIERDSGRLVGGREEERTREARRKTPAAAPDPLRKRSALPWLCRGTMAENFPTLGLKSDFDKEPSRSCTACQQMTRVHRFKPTPLGPSRYPLAHCFIHINAYILTGQKDVEATRRHFSGLALSKERYRHASIRPTNSLRANLY